ncbi:hypothetical protein [Haloplanus sp. C73]|uniref:hypothetical protein n=1 Tax=Haloplanus sp. C73 TaxID=3421641 RepID=UPI003EB6AF53
MSVTYRFGILLLLFGGFLSLSSTGLFSDIGLWALFAGALIGVLGLLRSGLPESK